MHEAQKVLHQNLKEASKEREEMIAEFKEANQENIRKLKFRPRPSKKKLENLETDATRTSDL